MGGVTRGCVFVSTQLPAPTSRLCWAAHPQHCAHGCGASTWGLWSPLCFSFSNDHDVDSVGLCVQRCVQSPRDVQLCRCGCCWDLGRGLRHRSQGSLCWEERRALSPLAGASGSAAPSPARVCEHAQFNSGRPEQRSLPRAPGLPGMGRGHSLVQQPGLCRVEAVNQLDITG